MSEKLSDWFAKQIFDYEDDIDGEAVHAGRKS
jgi:hypothetical protein